MSHVLTGRKHVHVWPEKKQYTLPRTKTEPNRQET